MVVVLVVVVVVLVVLVVVVVVMQVLLLLLGMATLRVVVVRVEVCEGVRWWMKWVRQGWVMM